MRKIFYLSNIFIFILLSFTLFKISYKTNDLKKEITNLQKKINKDKDDIRILKAEWTYLSSPKRIKELSDKYLNLQYQTSTQIKKDEEILAFNDKFIDKFDQDGRGKENRVKNNKVKKLKIN